MKLYFATNSSIFNFIGNFCNSFCLSSFFPLQKLEVSGFPLNWNITIFGLLDLILDDSDLKCGCLKFIWNFLGFLSCSRRFIGRDLTLKNGASNHAMKKLFAWCTRILNSIEIYSPWAIEKWFVIVLIFCNSPPYIIMRGVICGRLSLLASYAM